MKYIETERLVLRDWKDSDRSPFASMNADPIVMEYFPRRLSEQDSNHLVDKFQKQFREKGYGPYAVEIKKTNEFIGFVGLHDVDLDVPFAPAVEIAWRLDYAAWGKGYATEAAEAVLDNAFSKLHMPEIVAFAVYDNTRAINIMEKIGMKRDLKGDFDYPHLAKGSPLGKFVLYRAVPEKKKR